MRLSFVLYFSSTNSFYTTFVINIGYKNEGVRGHFLSSLNQFNCPTAPQEAVTAAVQLPYRFQEAAYRFQEAAYHFQEAVKITGFMQMSCPAAVMQRYAAPPEAVNGSDVSAFQIFKLVPLQSNC